jgi:hypothetical protein
MWLKLPKVWRACAKREFVLPIESWIFTFFQTLFLSMVLNDVIFHVTASIWMQSLWFFWEILQVPQCFESRHPSTKIILVHSYHKSKDRIWAMRTQIDLKVIYKRFKRERRPSKFHEFWSEEVHCKKDLQKRKVWCLKVIIHRKKGGKYYTIATKSSMNILLIKRNLKIINL